MHTKKNVIKLFTEKPLKSKEKLGKPVKNGKKDLLISNSLRI